LQPPLGETVKVSGKIIRYCVPAEDYLTGIEYFKNNFFESQEDIQNFLSGNYSQDRYESFIHLVDNLILKYNPVEAINTGY
jgi:hypothetical protein